MKNKLLIFLLCGVMVLGMTGCGNEKKESDNPDNNSQESVVTISDIFSNYHGGSAIVRINEKNEENEEVLNYYIADDTGNLKEYSGKTADVVSLNGYILYNTYKDESQSSNSDATIYDSKGKLVHSSSYDKEVFGDISKNGNVIVMATVDSLSGKTYKTQLQDKDGNVIFETEDKQRAGWLIDEVFYITDNKGVNLIDASTKKNIHIDTLFTNKLKASNGFIIVGQNIYDRKLNVINSNAEVQEILNEKYYLADNSDGYINSMKDNSIAHSFKEGGVSQIFYYDGVYYVRSKTDFNYTLNENFEYIAEPKKDSTGELFLTNEGIVSNVEGYCILDEKLNCKTKIGSKNDVGTLMSSEGDYLYFLKRTESTPQIYSYPNNAYNVKTKAFIEFKK